MYIKRKKINENAINKRLESICHDLLLKNTDAMFIISKKYIEKSKGNLQEIDSLPIIISSIPLNEVVMPSFYKIKDDGTLSTWCDTDPIIKIAHSKLKFTDGEINGKEIKNLYLDIEDEKELKKDATLTFKNY